MSIETRFNPATFSAADYSGEDRVAQILRQQYVLEILKSNGVNITDEGFIEWVKRSINHFDVRTLSVVFSTSSFHPRVQFAHYLQVLHCLEQLDNSFTQSNPWGSRMRLIATAHSVVSDVFSQVLTNIGTNIFEDSYNSMSGQISHHFFGSRKAKNRTDKDRLWRQSITARPTFLAMIGTTYPRSLNEVWTPH